MPSARARAFRWLGAGLAALLLAACGSWSSWEKPAPRAARSQVPARAALPPAGPGEYRVQAGDTLYSIAFRNSLDYRELARWNGIGGDYRIYAGQLLRLKPPAGARPMPAPAISAPPPSPPVASGPVEVVAAPGVAEPEAPPPGLPPAPVPEPLAELGQYEWAWPTLGKLQRGFGQEGSKGIDLVGRLGQPVFAAAPGRVVYSGNALKGYGELIIIKHDETFLSAYGYNRLRHVKEGDIVTGGQPIGELGLGPENQPMLHFEIRNKGQPIDPLLKLPKR
ncbi:lipoprotein NlpD [Solimonas aquatica]|uniref:Lipoprotein NlpD n=1 Tax=Solimonas aquatica TaxID=489703 RepID=A0A1H9AJN7_9GAMM|nr:peptidoglycan DD-metalloendopeptidase family protein [Solimonas aquatica]SEP76178.1 lipoprotein NlpD [Solimonas aquatica]